MRLRRSVTDDATDAIWPESLMNIDLAVALTSDMLMTVLTVALPILGVAMGVGLLISILQVVTQIQEMTLTFVPKIFAMVMACVLLMPFLLQRMMDYAAKMFGTMPVP